MNTGRLETIKKLYDEGYTLEDISKKLKLSEVTIRAGIKECYPNIKVKTNRIVTKERLEKEAIKMYLEDNNLTGKEIAKIIGLNLTYTNEAIRPYKEIMENEYKRIFKEFYDSREKCSISDIAEEFNKTVAIVYRIMGDDYKGAKYYNIDERVGYRVYKATCIITGLEYIGVTSTSIRERGNSHYRGKMMDSINKYGRKNHVYEELDFVEDKDTALELEAYYIDYYDTFNNGLNNCSKGTNGGLDHYWMKKEIIKCDLDGNEIKKYTSLRDAINDLNLSHRQSSNISLVLKGKQKQAYGFKWKYA